MNMHCGRNRSEDPNFECPRRKYSLSSKLRIRVKPKETPGMICIERHIHDEAIVISGSLIVEYDSADISAWIEEELGKAAHEVEKCGGILGQIKTNLTVTSSCMISMTEDKEMAKESSPKYARILLAAIMFMVNPKEAEDVVRQALAGVRTKLRESRE